eukprot:Lankesteria_metandrocarpae@DN3662_c0_g1_i1.p1
MAAVCANDLPVEQKEELLCNYAALILHDEGLEVNEANINKLVKASGTTVQSYMPMLVCRALANCKISEILTSAGTAVAAPAGGGAAAGGAAPAAEEKAAEPEEEEEEEDEDMGFSLFD